MINYRQKIYSKAFEDGINYAIEKIFAEEEEKKTNNRGLGKAIGIGSGLAATSHILQVPIESVAAYGKDALKGMADKEAWKELMKDRFATDRGTTSLVGKLAAGVGIAAAGYKIGKNNKNKEKD